MSKKTKRMISAEINKQEVLVYLDPNTIRLNKGGFMNTSLQVVFINEEDKTPTFQPYRLIEMNGEDRKALNRAITMAIQKNKKIKKGKKWHWPRKYQYVA